MNFNFNQTEMYSDNENSLAIQWKNRPHSLPLFKNKFSQHFRRISPHT